MTQYERHALRTWIEIDRSAIERNITAFRGLISHDTRLMAVVKSNAYGHGLTDFAKEAVCAGADWLGVDSIVEGAALRREGVDVPILVLGHTLNSRVREAAEHNISITISDSDVLEDVISVAEREHIVIPVHIKVDTGMHRQGFTEDHADALVERLSRTQAISLEGVYTHFAAAKNPSFPEYTQKQIALFEKWRTRFQATGFTPMYHAAASSGTILFPDAHYDMVRIGIGAYGLYPSQEVAQYAKDYVPLAPALTWKAVVAETKNLPMGSRTGYDLTETLPRDSRIAVCPVGYWHGYPRMLSSIGHVIVRGKRARVLGKVSMDMLVIDITDIPEVCVGDEVTLLGADGKERVSAEELGRLSETNNYEVVTRINPLIHRFYQ